MQHSVPGAVGGGARTLRGSLAVISGHAAERTLVDLAVVTAREGQSPVLELVNRLGGVAAEILDGILIAQPVRAFHGVVHVPAPVVLAHVAERRSNAALRRHGVRPCGKHLGDARGLKPGLAAADHGSQPRRARADHYTFGAMILDGVSRAVHSRRLGAGSL